MKITNIRATFDLCIAALFWGFGFIAMFWCLDSFTPIQMTGLRFALAALISLPFTLTSKEVFFFPSRAGIIAGVLLGLSIVFQSWGLLYTSITKSGFITTLYIVIIPIIQALLLKQHLYRWHMFYVFIALIGVALIVELQMTKANLGDLLTLFCALFAAIHAVWLGVNKKFTTRPFLFNMWQSLWASILFLALSYFEEWPQLSQVSSRAWFGLFALVCGSSMIAFTLQIKAQRVLAPATASMIFLLESPFAAFFAILLLSEKMSAYQALGAGLIFLAATLTSLNEGKVSYISNLDGLKKAEH